MTIRSMLLRLESAFGQNLETQMLLQPGLESFARCKTDRNFAMVIGYSGSTNSQAALDFALWMAHQTRVATCKQVTVHVMYVLEQPALSVTTSLLAHRSDLYCPTALAEEPAAIATLSRPVASDRSSITHADEVLWQARCLADEWRGSFEAHLGFGKVAPELRRVVEQEQADLLIVGCSDPKHPLVKQLSCNPCPVLGIPAEG